VYGRIDIGTFQAVSNVILPVVVRQLRAEHPDCDIRLSLPAREIYLHWPGGRTQSPLAVRAIEIALEVATELADDPTTRPE
jgi:hypothetical protein